MTATPSGLLPSSVSGGSNSTYFPDYCDLNSGSQFARCGGGAYCGAYCGAFCVFLYNDVSYSNWGYGVALAFKVYDTE